MKRFLALLLLVAFFGCEPEPRPVIVVPPRRPIIGPIIVPIRPGPIGCPSCRHP